jgi:hypothetical protein
MEAKDLYCDDEKVEGLVAEETELKIVPDTGEGRNNATIFPMGGSIPICEYEIYNEEHQIWKGKLVIPPSASGASDVVFFSRFYQPEINDLDKLFVEIEMEATDLIGIPFILVPKEKLMFGYFAGSSTIVIPKKKIIKHPRMQ